MLRSKKAGWIKMKPTAQQLKNKFRYDPETGSFFRIDNGKISGCIDKNGYWHIYLNKKVYYAHRLAWLYMTDNWPTVEIDHKNGIRNDNRWLNLREANHHEQRRNRKSAGTNSGYKAVWRHKNGRFKSHITVNYKRIHLGYFSTAEEAHRAYRIAAEKYHKEFARFE